MSTSTSTTEPTQHDRQANLARLLAPRSIAFVGGAYAAAAIRTCRSAGYAGEIYAVNPKRREIGGVACVQTIADLPPDLDAAFVAIPADETIETVAELRKSGAGGAVCYASGFSEFGEVGQARNAALLQAADGLALVGPNCFGIINYVTDASLWPVPYLKSATRRGAAVVGQSGNVCINLSMNQRSVPFSYIISAGNLAVLGFEDYIDYLSDDPHVTCIGLFMEGIRDVHAFSQACLRANRKGVPIIAFRVGTSALGAELAASHTSSLAGQNELYEALFQRLGVLSTSSVPQFLEALKVASVWNPVRGRRLAVFSSSGGDNGMAADYASTAGLALPPPSEHQAAAVKALLPDYAQVTNPLDFTAGYWGAEHLLTPMFSEMLTEGYDQGLLVVDHPLPELGSDVAIPVEAMVRSLGTASRNTGVPGAVTCVNPESMPKTMREQVIAEGLLPLQGIHDAGPVLGLWADYSERQFRQPSIAAPLRVAALFGTRRIVNEMESKRRLAACGLCVPDGRLCRLEELATAARLPGRFALKALSDELPHKTEVGGVALGLKGGDLLEAARAMCRRVEAARPGLQLNSFLLEAMVDAPVAELIVGIKRDPLFGLVLVVGAGGVLVELMQDAQRLLLPVSAAEIEEALRRLKAFPLLDGFRGRPRGDVEAAVRAILAVATFAKENRETLYEVDVNPLMVLAEGAGAVAADALIVEAQDDG